MRPPAAIVALALATAPAAAEVTVRVSGAHVDLTATAAPLADVLERLGRQTGMKVVYEGPAPRQLVTLSLHGRTPAETVLSLLEGLGVNFALVSDPTGARVQTLVVAGAAQASPSSGSGRAADAAPARRPFGPPPGASPEIVEPGFEEGEEEPEVDEEVFAGQPPGAEGADPAVPDPNAAVPGGPGAVPPPGAGQVPTQPSPFSSSPFTPQPQPFPPPPPLVPGAPPAGTPPPEEGAVPASPPPG